MAGGRAAQLAQVFKRARRGLFGGKTVLSGNKVSEDGGNRCAAGATGAGNTT